MAWYVLARAVCAGSTLAGELFDYEAGFARAMSSSGMMCSQSASGKLIVGEDGAGTVEAEDDWTVVTAP
jgi:hypothetical protein